MSIITIRAKTYDEQMAEIEAKYAPKLAVYTDLIIKAMAVDGPSQSTKIATFSTKYNELISQKNAEVEAIPVE